MRQVGAFLSLPKRGELGFWVDVAYRLFEWGAGMFPHSGRSACVPFTTIYKRKAQSHASIYAHRCNAHACGLWVRL